MNQHDRIKREVAKHSPATAKQRRDILTIKRRLEHVKEPTAKLIKPIHKAFINRWRKRLGLKCELVLTAYYKNDKKVSSSNALAWFWPLIDGGPYVIGLSNVTLRSTDWRDSIVHELLHAVFHESLARGRSLSMKREEHMIGMLAPMLTRQARKSR